MSPEGDVAEPNVQEGYQRVGPVGVCHFPVAVRADSRVFPPTSEEDRRREPAGSDSRRALEAWCSRTETLQAQIPTRLFTLLSKDKVVLFWQPPSYFSPWSPSSFGAHDVPYSCSEQYTMAEKTRPFQYHRAVELIMSSHLVQAHATASVEACATLTPVLGTGRSKTPVLSGTYAKFTQNPAIRYHLLSSNNKIQAESSPLDPVWSIGLQTGDFRANNPCLWRGQICSVRYLLPFPKIFATVRPGRRTRPHLVGSAPALRMKSPRSLVRRDREVESDQRSQRFPFGVSNLFLGRAGQLNAVEVLTLRCQNTAPVSSGLLL